MFMHLQSSKYLVGNQIKLRYIFYLILKRNFKFILTKCMLFFFCFTQKPSRLVESIKIYDSFKWVDLMYLILIN